MMHNVPVIRNVPVDVEAEVTTKNRDYCKCFALTGKKVGGCLVALPDCTLGGGHWKPHEV